RPNNNASIQQHERTPVLERRVPPQSPHQFSQQQHYIQNNENSNRPYSSDIHSLSSQRFHGNQNARILNQVNNVAPTMSPSTKRKFDELMVKNGKKPDQLVDAVESLVQEQREVTEGLRVLNKTTSQSQKYMRQLIKSIKVDVTPNKCASQPQLPVYMHNEQNLFSSISSDLPITTILCRVIRKLYSTEEIENGIAENEHDERFQIVKNAMVAAFFVDEPVKFDIFWQQIGKKHIGGQKRAQKRRNKKLKTNHILNSEDNSHSNEDGNDPSSYSESDFDN
ncbi:unnamed protein product, partial [Rotaria magnacalcarata]